MFKDAPSPKAGQYGLPGFFLLRNTARSFSPKGQKTPDTARAFFGLRDPRRKESPSASLSREVSRLAATEGVLIASLSREGDRLRWKEFRLLVFSLARILFSQTPSVAYGDSGPGGVPGKICKDFLGIGPSGGSLSGRGTACVGRNPRCLPLEGGGAACRDGRSFVSLSFLSRSALFP